MAFEGQPIPTTLEPIAGGKISDGKSVRVSVPENTTVESGGFYLLDGFFGMAIQSVTTEVGETAEVILSVEQAEYETDNIVTTDSFNIGEKVYWDGSKFTTAADDGGAPATAYRFVGRVTVAKDTNNVIWFILGPQV